MERRTWVQGFRSAQRTSIPRLGEPIDPLARGFRSGKESRVIRSESRSTTAQRSVDKPPVGITQWTAKVNTFIGSIALSDYLFDDSVHQARPANLRRRDPDWLADYRQFARRRCRRL